MIGKDDLTAWQVQEGHCRHRTTERDLGARLAVGERLFDVVEILPQQDARPTMCRIGAVRQSPTAGTQVHVQSGQHCRQTPSHASRRSSRGQLWQGNEVIEEFGNLCQATAHIGAWQGPDRCGSHRTFLVGRVRVMVRACIVMTAPW